MNVFWSKPFILDTYQKYPPEDRQKIRNFTQHVESKGFQGLPGRNKSSEPPPSVIQKHGERAREAKVLVKQHNLWHYHVGIRTYITQGRAYGDYTSNKVLHYCRYSDHIKVVDVSKHPPFALPREKYLLATDWVITGASGG